MGSPEPIAFLHCILFMESSFFIQRPIFIPFSIVFLDYLKLDLANFRKSQSLDRKSNKTHAIKCGFVGDGFVSISWKKDGLTSLPSRMKQVGNSLIIHNLRFTDGGVYFCTVKGNYNEITGKINVNVFGKIFYLCCVNHECHVLDQPWCLFDSFMLR